MDTLLLELNGIEVMFLADAVLNRDVTEGSTDVESRPIARPLLLKLGSAYCELVSDKGILEGAVTVAVTQEEAWLLRSKVRSGDLGPGNTPLGIPLLLKLYGLLAVFNADLELPEAEEGYDDLGIMESQRQYLRGVRAKEEADARREPDEDTSRDTDPSTGA